MSQDPGKLIPLAILLMTYFYWAYAVSWPIPVGWSTSVFGRPLWRACWRFWR